MHVEATLPNNALLGSVSQNRVGLQIAPCYLNGSVLSAETTFLDFGP